MTNAVSSLTVNPVMDSSPTQQGTSSESSKVSGFDALFCNLLHGIKEDKDIDDKTKSDFSEWYSGLFGALLTVRNMVQNNPIDSKDDTMPVDLSPTFDTDRFTSFQFDPRLSLVNGLTTGNEENLNTLKSIFENQLNSMGNLSGNFSGNFPSALSPAQVSQLSDAIKNLMQDNKGFTGIDQDVFMKSMNESLQALPPENPITAGGSAQLGNAQKSDDGKIEATLNSSVYFENIHTLNEVTQMTQNNAQGSVVFADSETVKQNVGAVKETSEKIGIQNPDLKNAPTVSEILSQDSKRDPLGIFNRNNIQKPEVEVGSKDFGNLKAETFRKAADPKTAAFNVMGNQASEINEAQEMNPENVNAAEKPQNGNTVNAAEKPQNGNTVNAAEKPQNGNTINAAEKPQNDNTVNAPIKIQNDTIVNEAKADGILDSETVPKDKVLSIFPKDTQEQASNSPKTDSDTITQLQSGIKTAVKEQNNGSSLESSESSQKDDSLKFKSMDQKKQDSKITEPKQIIDLFTLPKNGIPHSENRLALLESKDKLAEAVGNQIKSAVFTMQQDKKEFEIQLKPDFLGNIVIKLQSGQDGMRVRISTSNLDVKEVLSSQFPQIQEALKDQGVDLRNAEVIYTGLNNNSQNAAGDGRYRNTHKKSVSHVKGEYERVDSGAIEAIQGKSIINNGSLNYLV